MYGYIYKTTNLVNGKIYIGQHKFEGDCIDLSYIGSGRNLKRAINKYGKENFKCEIIEWCESFEEINEKEIYWIKFYKSNNSSIGYNIENGGRHNEVSNSTKKLLSDYAKNRRGKLNPFYGKHHTDYSKKLIGEKSMGRQTFLGKHHSDEIKKKMSELRKGKIPTNSVKVKCLNDGKIFMSYSKASKFYNISPGSIANSINKNKKLRCGLQFIKL